MENVSVADQERDIPFAGALTRADVRRAASLSLQPQRWGKLGLAILAVVFVVGLVVGPLQGGAPWIEALLPIVLLGAAALLLWTGFRRAWDKSFATNRLAQEERQGMVSASGLTIRTLHGTSDLSWGLFHKVRAADDLVLLYISANQFQPFPQRFFASETDWQEFRRRALLHVTTRPPDAGLPAVLRVALTWIIIFVLVLITWVATKP